MPKYIKTHNDITHTTYTNVYPSTILFHESLTASIDFLMIASRRKPNASTATYIIIKKVTVFILHLTFIIMITYQFSQTNEMFNVCNNGFTF
jgi:hypothetical protein